MYLFFAGSENQSHKHKLQRSKAKNVLLSYYYFRKRKIDIEEYFESFDRVTLDSGAFTLLESAQKRHKIINHDEYVEEYINFIKKYKGRFFWVANYDLGIAIGEKKVREYNEEFRRQLEPEQRVCYVAHDYTIPYINLEEYFNLYDFVGISSNYKGEKNDIGYLALTYNLSLRHRKLVHGFAMTNFVSMTNYPLYSADSTTYLGAHKYGSTYVWNGSYFETWDYTQKHRRKTLYGMCEELGINFDLFSMLPESQEALNEITVFNIHSWLKNEEKFNRLTKNRQWWLHG